MDQQASNYPIRLFSGRLFAIFLSVFIIFFSDIIKADIGLDWLSGQATAEGSYASNGDVATTFQATSETIHTLHTLDAITQANLQNSLLYLKADTVRNTENLSRAILINTLAGSETTSLITDLSKHGNSDGGFGDFAGHESTTVDTAFALEALAVGGGSVPQAAGNAVAYLASKQNPDGGFSLSGSNESNVYITSLCLRALQNYIFQYNVSGVISSASQYLLSKQSITGGWETDWETAIALLAVAPITSDPTRYADAVLALQKRQNTDGSWGGSVYTTALALRALHNIKNLKPPVDVTKGVFTGRVVEETTNTPLAKASVSLNDAANTTVLTDVDGTFTMTNVTQNNYTLSYAIDGYGSATQAAGVSAGQRVDLGTIRLPRLPDTGILSGVVSDASSGLPISGATVQVTGALSTLISVNNDGSFRLVSAPGDITITVSADGYTTSIGSGTMVAGRGLNFSPTLYPVSTPPPNASSVSISGNVVDVATGLPLPNATITILNTFFSTASDADGRFAFANVEPGSLQIEVAAEGYLAFQSSFLASSGGNVDAGVIYLTPNVKPQTSSVKGLVIDATTGLPLPGVAVVVGGTAGTATSDANGNFLLEGITALNFSVSASASGYSTFETQLVLQEPSRIQMNVPMQPAVTGGLEIVSVSANQLSYDAYNKVDITNLLSSSSNEPQVARLYVTVYDESGTLLEQYPAVSINDQHEAVHNHSPEEAFLTIQPGEQISAPAAWYTDAYPPGQYRVVIQAFDAFKGSILSERELLIKVNETRYVETLIVSTEPNYTTQGSTEALAFDAQVVHKSNVPFSADVSFSFLSPSGQTLHTGKKTIELKPTNSHFKIHLSDFQFSFNEAGEYRVLVDSVTNATPLIQQGKSLYVAPGTHVEIEQGLSPDILVPDGDKQISIQIRLKGVVQ